MIANKIAQIPEFPYNLNVSTHDDTHQFGDFLSIYDVSGYLGITYDEAENLINSGELDSTIYRNGEICIISKQALQEWVNSQTGKR